MPIVLVAPARKYVHVCECVHVCDVCMCACVHVCISLSDACEFNKSSQVAH